MSNQAQEWGEDPAETRNTWVICISRNPSKTASAAEGGRGVRIWQDGSEGDSSGHSTEGLYTVYEECFLHPKTHGKTL